MSEFYKSVSDKFSQYPKGSVYEHIWTERTPNGDSGLRDNSGYDSRIASTLLQDTRFFEPVDTNTQPQTQQSGGDELAIKDWYDLQTVKDVMDGYKAVYTAKEAEERFNRMLVVMQHYADDYSQAREQEAEERGRDNTIMELVQGWSGLAEDIRTIQHGASSLERKAAALATRLSVLHPNPQAGEGTP